MADEDDLFSAHPPVREYDGKGYDMVTVFFPAELIGTTGSINDAEGDHAGLSVTVTDDEGVDNLFRYMNKIVNEYGERHDPEWLDDNEGDN